MVWITLSTNFLAVGFALLLALHGPRSLRRLTFVLWCMSLAQLAGALHRYGLIQSQWGSQFAAVAESAMGLLGLCAFFLIGKQIVERKTLEVRSRLFEQESLPLACTKQTAAAFAANR